ncbi:carbohydrate sulfotransferase [Plakobranchus ocellatus]|uniref:Carbohydrate sulfotransferase n=1 Tax=Plakobranchus ocellatus TaxID=259542 RepID=A0AAV3ZID2_9GAST|nr:carbohydrate sulfotransferase [Plakobranchus ocellatus]
MSSFVLFFQINAAENLDTRADTLNTLMQVAEEVKNSKIEDTWLLDEAWASTTTESSRRDFEDFADESPPDIDTPERIQFLRERFQQRSRLLDKQCSEPQFLKSTSTNIVRTKRMNIAYGKLRYCPVPKVGTTFTKSIQRHHFSKNSHERKARDQKSYFLVREPYSRLMSGYIGKIVTNQVWWGTFGRLIIRNFRPKADRLAKQCGNGATFPEFVKYLIYSQEKSKYLNTHFQPIHQQCSICHTNYDYVGHLETLSDDMKFMLHSVGITGKNLNFDDSIGTVRGKCRDIIKRRPQITKCQDMCSMMRTVWWSFQARGLISENIELPVKGKRCDTISGDEFTEIALKAHNVSAGNIDRSKQKRSALVELFTQVPLQDRLRLRELYLADFELFGYDSMPHDLFPELHNEQSNDAL